MAIAKIHGLMHQSLQQKPGGIIALHPKFGGWLNLMLYLALRPRKKRSKKGSLVFGKISRRTRRRWTPFAKNLARWVELAPRGDRVGIYAAAARANRITIGPAHPAHVLALAGKQEAIILGRAEPFSILGLVTRASKDFVRACPHLHEKLPYSVVNVSFLC